MALKDDIKQIAKPFYLINIMLSLSYIIGKRTPILCNYLFKQEICELDGRETEILFFLLIVIMMRTRRSGRVTMVNYLSASFIYTKIANVILWFYTDFVMGILFAIVCIFTALLLPEPTYSGPQKVIYLRDFKSLEDELNRDKKITWLVEFYTVWSPACIDFAPSFSELSYKYTLDNLKFGKFDVGRYPDAAKKFRINDSSLSRQLPTLILFQEGVEVDRRPTIDSKNKVIKFSFCTEAVSVAFNLTSLYGTCKLKIKGKKNEHTKSE